MTAEQFYAFWKATYPDTIPISHFFRHSYNERWFRIHSLPESKRYAETEQEWNTLLSRQNTIISDFISDSNELYLVTGEYYQEGEPETEDFLSSDCFKGLEFISLPFINLHAISPNTYDEDSTYKPSLAKVSWKPKAFDVLLKSIANDEVRAFFVSVDKKCLIAPYDGGMDFVLESVEVKDTYKNKYKDWLSKHPEGL